MLLSEKEYCRCIIIYIIFISINSYYTETNVPKFLSSNIEIVPNLVILNSTSTFDFICINHQSNDLPLEVSLSKPIPSDQIKLSTNVLNETAIRIRLESKNYVGIFHLLCFSNGEKNKGTRTDVIVKAAPGVLQLAERCRVYDRQYIKCVIRAQTIARAIQNDYPAKFEFNELSDSSDHRAYNPRFEFLKNESTNEYLTFKWKPTIEGEFPNGVRMNMKAILPHFDVSTYYFDMTPIFRIKPKFILQAISSSEIQIGLTPISPRAFCEKSIIPKLQSNINQTWTVVEPDQKNILINNLLSNSIYRVCMKCRQTYNDPDGTEECQEMKTLSFVSNQTSSIFVIGLLFFILLAIICLIVLFVVRKRSRNQNKQIDIGNTLINDHQHGRNRNIYVIGEHEPTERTRFLTNNNSAIFDTVSIQDENDQEDPMIDPNDENYIHIAPMEDVIQMHSTPQLLS